MAHSLHRAGQRGALLAFSSAGRQGIQGSIPAFLAPTFASQTQSFPLTAAWHVVPSASSLQRRQASSSSTRPPQPSNNKDNSAVSPRQTKNARLNAPPSTLPPVLNSPTRQPGQSAPGYWFALGKSYIGFFKAGVKAVWTNHKSARALRQEKGVTGSGGAIASADKALDSGILTRGDWHLLRRARSDSVRLPIFGLILLVCGEFTVLLLPLVSGIVPRTCQIPAQVRHNLTKAETRRDAAFKQGSSQVVASPEELAGRTPQTGPDALKTPQLVHAGRSLGLYSKWWDRLWDQPPRWVLLRRVRAWQAYVDRDDAAIAKFGGVKDLDEEELRLAVAERGVDVLGRKPEQLRLVMEKWLAERKRQSVFNLVLTRPSAWGRGGG